MTSKPTRQAAQPLKTRHVFFDTEAYRRAGFNLRNSQFKTFGEYVEAGRLSLHTTDITFMEINRQIAEDVTEKTGRLNKIARDFGRMAQIAPGMPTLPKIDEGELTRSTWRGVLDILVSEFSANHILALDVHPRKIFEKYFAEVAPFAKRGSKEFPDAFIVEALADYCSKHQMKMYVVSGDTAFRDAAASHTSLIPLASIDELLASCVAESDADIEPLVDAIFDEPYFDYQLIQTLQEQSDYLEGLYFGDLVDGTVKAIFVDEVLAVDGYTLAAIDDDSISLILEVPCILRATVGYLYVDLDVEEGDAEYVTSATESVRNRAHLKLYVRIDKKTTEFKEKELLTKRAIFE
ncbi:hypothetical protein C6558_23700 [Ensifer sp. NM-2]|uniref:PIN domain-containing protein n=1 Tax=Ensifer sp. NM-2 TaxID=2109730 RepID=UPI000D13E6EB|nr:PIN domain-containing protein [Ensifer sp. NM-2]PSS62176.1 hypothetical protein C6558_23700 [Ensifer sp. NM-2]